MLIKTQLRLVALLPAVFALAIAGVMWVATLKVDQARHDAEIAEKALRLNFELNILTQEYLLYGGTPVESQFRINHQSMGEVLARLKSDEPEEHALVEALLHGHQELGSIFNRLLESKTAAREQIVAALQTKTQDIRAKTRQFADIQRQQVMKYQRRAIAIITVALAALAGLSMTLLALMGRRLMLGIDQLEDGVRRVAAGDLEHQIQLATADELGALANSFNAFTDKLKDEMTRRQQAEREIHQLNAELEQRVSGAPPKLEAANKELEAFAYSVSHDLRAPLRAIDGFSRKVVLGYGDKLDDEGRRQLQVVRDNAQRMGQLIDDLLAFSRMGRREMALQPLDMDAMVKSVADELRAAEPQRAIEFAFSPLPRALGDAAMLRQVWVNLLGNAVKFYAPAPGRAHRGRRTRRKAGKSSTGSRTMAPASTCSMPTSCSAYSSACTARTSSRVPASAWPSPSASCTATTAASGARANRTRAQRSASLCLCPCRTTIFQEDKHHERE